MKSYEEALDIIIHEDRVSKRIRYHRWAAALVVSQIYGVSDDTVMKDLKNKSEAFHLAERKKRKEEARIANEARRQANIARGGRITLVEK